MSNGYDTGLNDIADERAQVLMSVHKDKGKLGNIPDFMSMNTHPFLIPRCNTCKINDLCYARRLILTARRNANHRYAYNTAILSSKEFDDSMIPQIPRYVKMIRINSMGEIDDDTMMNNIIDIVNYYPDKAFTVYSRAYDVIEKISCKPDNLHVVASGLNINDFNPEIPNNADKKFMVGDDSINLEELRFPVPHHLCTGKCHTCMNCYRSDGKAYIIAPMR